MYDITYNHERTEAIGESGAAVEHLRWATERVEKMTAMWQSGSPQAKAVKRAAKKLRKAQEAALKALVAMQQVPEAW